MPQLNEYCVRCRRLAPMRVTRAKKKVRRQGEMKTIEVVNYHCGRCFGFVRSETVAPGDDPPAN